MDQELLETLLFQKESETLDFKKLQYPLAGADERQKSELVKDVLAFANAWKTSDAHILIGVEDTPSSRANVLGVTEQLDDADLQQLINQKTNRPIRFRYEPGTIEGKSVAVITIDREQERPLFLRKNFGKLDADIVYIRRGSSTDTADPDEVAQMGRSSVSKSRPEINLELASGIARQRLGRTSTVKSKILRDPPPPPRPPLRFQIDMQRYAVGIGTRPSPDAVRHYLCQRALLTPLRFWVKNEGSVTAPDAYAIISGPKTEGLVVADSPPLRPTGLGLDASLSNPACDISVREYEDRWEIIANIGKLQPKAQRWLEDAFYVGARTSMSWSLSAQIFDDALPSPIQTSLCIEIVVEENVYNKKAFDSPGD